MPLVCVAMPVHRAGDIAALRRAFGSICAQSLGQIEILLIANGSDEGTLAELERLAGSERRARVIELDEGNLAAAINEGLREAGCDLVARMDADDWSHPDRLRIQYEFMKSNSEVAAVGSGWETVEPSGRRVRMEVPGDAGQMRWRLLLGNPLAHGSMMLRKSMVLEVGGYDHMCRRAQDYDLWLRLSARYPIAAVREVLYEYHSRHAGGREESVKEQALTAANSLVRAWSGLPPLPAGSRELAELAAGIAPVIGGERGGDGVERIERVLQESGPSVAGLIARLWLEWEGGRRGGRAGDVQEVCRMARVREVARAIAEAGASRVWLWGAGRHTRWLLERRAELGMPIAGIVDDAASGQRRGEFVVAGPDVLKAGEWVLISSDGFEGEIWASGESARARGVNMRRIYGVNPGENSG